MNIGQLITTKALSSLTFEPHKLLGPTHVSTHEPSTIHPHLSPTQSGHRIQSTILTPPLHTLTHDCSPLHSLNPSSPTHSRTLHLSPLISVCMYDSDQQKVASSEIKVQLKDLADKGTLK